jgi:hypothetical protein
MNLFVSGCVRQKPLYFQIKLILSSLPENKYLLFAAQKQYLEPPFSLKNRKKRGLPA